MTYAQHLNQLRKDMFECAFDPDICGYATINDLAIAADLDWKTVERLYLGRTKRPAHRTIEQIAKAVGLPIKYTRPPAEPKRKKRTARAHG